MNFMKFLNLVPLEDVPDLHLCIPAIGKDSIAEARTFDESLTSAARTLGS
jgi:hypothetical protein